MDEGGYAPHLNATVKRFNGALFRNRAAVALDKDDIRELWIAATRDWRDVEPAIFGTLLERALDERERAKLGAHYTPRAYVERLVVPTVIEPLRADWEEALTRAHEQEAAGDRDGAHKTVKDFHHSALHNAGAGPGLRHRQFPLCRARTDETAGRRGAGSAGRSWARTCCAWRWRARPSIRVSFFGLELNPRAVAIADLVLWLGYLKWQLRNVAAKYIVEPILHAYGNIKEQDAILAWDRQELLRDDKGRLLSRWDGITTKQHPITGEDIPDPAATVPLHRYESPRRADWPEAEFIVGNPPFIGGKDMRAELGDGYAEACWKARPTIPGGADYVMHFWDEAAARLLRKPEKKGEVNPLRRFGFITTNSITQTFSRRVIERRMKEREPLSMVYAVPDHPWLKAAGKAAVRIAMTVAARGEREGKLATVERESGLNTDTPVVELRERIGKTGANLKIGPNLSAVQPLIANEAISSRGVSLHGSGFIVTPQRAASLGLGRTPGLEDHILPYRNGRDIAQRPRGVMVIDLYGLSSDEVRERFPKVFQHVTDRVRPERDQNNRKSYRENWWIFGEPRSDLRPVLEPLDRYIATVETSRHRFFQFLDADIRPDNKLVNIGVRNGESLSVLSSRSHVVWSIRAGSWIGAGNDPVYAKTETFDPFPFPEREAFESLNALGDRLDSFRKKRLSEHDFLTMTSLYNALERMRELDNGCNAPPLSAKERDIHEAGLVSILKEIHDDIDRATLEAYGWADLIPALVGKPGATTPSPHKTPEQEAAEEDLLSRLVALNRERAEEERRGHVRWLRPDYQIPKLGDRPMQIKADLVASAPAAGKPDWPEDGLDQLRAVADMLRRAAAPLAAESLGKAFKGRNTAKRKRRVAEVLDALAETGPARQTADGRYFIPR